jgi:hypothetical protein
MVAELAVDDADPTRVAPPEQVQSADASVATGESAARTRDRA